MDGLTNITGQIMGYLIMNGLCNSVLSDYLWARAVILTSATVATIGMSFTIPLAIISDYFIQNKTPTVFSIFGALFVVIGFMLVNVSKEHETGIMEYLRSRYRRISRVC